LYFREDFTMNLAMCSSPLSSNGNSVIGPPTIG
jgi:hypothetical protein